jgi:hypothetical protein
LPHWRGPSSTTGLARNRASSFFSKAVRCSSGIDSLHIVQISLNLQSTMRAVFNGGVCMGYLSRNEALP